MRKLILLFMCTLVLTGVNAQSLIGAWECNYTLDGEALKSVVIFSEGYQAMTTYDANTGAFKHANGGTWELVGRTMTEKVEFDSKNTDSVGSEISFEIMLSDSIVSIVGSDKQYVRIDNGAPRKPKNAWLMSGRIKDGVVQERDTSRPRKTMKIFSGTRFQWIAYDTKTKEFKGTGGGTYTKQNGEYIENIEFFSRDNSRVGAVLKFNYSLVEGQWHHKGLSSKGDPFHEIWSVRE